MPTLARKQLFLLCLIFIYTIINTSTLLAQPEFIFTRCEKTDNYTINGTYHTNLDTALSTLPTTNSGFGFYNFSTGQGRDTVYSIALCRGDINPDVCIPCLSHSNNTLFGYPNKRNYLIRFNSQKLEQFNGALRPLMDTLRRIAAAGGSQLKFATGNSTGPGVSIYGLLQCTPDLTEEQCNDCLAGEIARIGTEDIDNLGGKVFLPMCNIRYEIYRFFNETTQTIFLMSPQPPPQPPGKKKNTNRTVVMITIIVSMIVVIITSSLCIFMRVRKNRKNQILRPPIHCVQSQTVDITVEFRQYNFSTLKEATNEFSEANKLGQGGFGAVYKGKLEDGREVAVKRLAKDSSQGDLEFKNEVFLVAKLHHRNLVRLLGFSMEENERLLVYEYLANSSLDHFIFVKLQGRRLL